jgi:hypothetical protein
MEIDVNMRRRAVSARTMHAVHLRTHNVVFTLRHSVSASP